jgi:phasin family protein
MSETPVETAQTAMTNAASAMKSHAEQATASAQDMGRQMMEKGMAGMAEFSRLFADMKMPGMGGMETFLAAQRRNMEVLSAANRVALEGAQAVAKRHMEIMQQTMAEMTESMRDLASPESPQVKAAKQADMLKVAYERAVSHIRELADLIQKSNGEAIEMLNKRFSEALDEVKKLAAQSAPGAHS